MEILPAIFQEHITLNFNVEYNSTMYTYGIVFSFPQFFVFLFSVPMKNKNIINKSNPNSVFMRTQFLSALSVLVVVMLKLEPLI